MELGQWVVPGTQVAKVMLSRRREAVLRIPADRAGQVRVGQRAEVRTSLGSSNRNIPGRVRRVAPGSGSGHGRRRGRARRHLARERPPRSRRRRTDRDTTPRVCSSDAPPERLAGGGGCAASQAGCGRVGASCEDEGWTAIGGRGGGVGGIGGGGRGCLVGYGQVFGERGGGVGVRGGCSCGWQQGSRRAAAPARGYAEPDRVRRNCRTPAHHIAGVAASQCNSK